MRIAAFDIGKRNFAICVEEVNHYPPTETLLLLENHDLTTRGDDLIPIMLEMTRILTSHHDLFDSCCAFLVEQQMFFGKLKNPLAVKLAQHCLSHFINRYGVLRDIQEFPAYHKTRVYNTPKMNKPQRKKWAIDKAISVLSERSDPLLPTLLQYKKKDDVADTVLHVQAYKILNDLNHPLEVEVEEEKMSEVKDDIDYNSLKKPELKELCRQNGLAVSGNKNVLIARLTGNPVPLKQFHQVELPFGQSSAKPKKRTKAKRNTVRTNTKQILKRLESNRTIYHFTRNGDGFYTWDDWVFNEVTQVVDRRMVNGRRVALTTDDLRQAKDLGLPLDLSCI
jgi:hypothetical protein